VHSDAYTSAVLKDERWFRFRFNFCEFVYVWHVSCFYGLDYTLVLLLFAFVVLGLVSSKCYAKSLARKKVSEMTHLVPSGAYKKHQGVR